MRDTNLSSWVARLIDLAGAIAIAIAIIFAWIVFAQNEPPPDSTIQDCVFVDPPQSEPVCL